MIPEVNRQFWQKLSREVKENLHTKLIDEAATRAVRFSKERFRQKNWVDAAPQKWKPRQRKGRGSLLVRSGRLKRSIRILNKTATSVTIGTDVPYARIHNEGGTIREKVFVKQHTRKRSARQNRGTGKIQVKAHTRMMNTQVPPRPFIGESRALLNKIEKKMNKLAQNFLK